MFFLIKTVHLKRNHITTSVLCKCLKMPFCEKIQYGNCQHGSWNFWKYVLIFQNETVLLLELPFKKTFRLQCACFNADTDYRIILVGYIIPKVYYTDL